MFCNLLKYINKSWKILFLCDDPFKGFIIPGIVFVNENRLMDQHVP